MKRTVLSKMTMATGILLACAAMHGVSAAEEPAKPAAAAGEQAAVKKVDVKEAAGAPKNAPEESKQEEQETLVTMHVPLGSPLFANVPIAVVNGDKIPLEEFDELLSRVHQSVTGPEGAGPGGMSFDDLVKRLVNTRLFVQEAKNIELDKLPEIKDLLETGTKRILRETLYLKVARQAKPDEKAVAQVYDKMRREVKLKGVAFKDEQDAAQFVKDVKAGKSFDELAAQAVKDNLAELPGGEGNYSKIAQLHPKVAPVVSPLAVNAVTPVIPLGDRFLVFKVLGTRNDESPALKEEARANLAQKAQLDALKAFKLALYKKYTKENTKLFNKLDFEAKTPGFDKLLEDKRVLVTVKGDKPITVADLARGLQAKFYHGVALAANEKKVNSAKRDVLDDILSKVVYTKEALAQHLDTSEECRKKTDEFTRSTLFGAFIEKVIRPDVKGTEEDLKTYYKEHIKKFTSPERLMLDQLVYKKSADAKSAIDKLRKGMDFKWLQTNAEGLVDKNAPGLENFAGEPVTTSMLAPEVQKALAGSKLGDFRFYESPEGYGYVFYVVAVDPERQQPYADVRDDIMKAVYAQKLAKAVDDWGDKLRKASTVKIYLDLGKKK